MSCDVPGCANETYMGWRPLTERLGRKVCEYHWRRHEDQMDNFDLFEAFGFRRPAGVKKHKTEKDITRCTCGRERLPGRKYCTQCATERERQRKKRAYHERKNRHEMPVEPGAVLRCRACGAERETGHTYCQRCAERRRKAARRQAQSRYWKKLQKC